jgi:hypothetical protein
MRSPTLRALNQSGVPEPNDFFRTGLASTRHRVIHDALPSREQSSKSGNPPVARFRRGWRIYFAGAARDLEECAAIDLIVEVF